MQSLSVCVTTFNNARTLAACLESVKWADEILLLDSHSNDDTLEIARRHGCAVHQQEFAGYGKQKQRAFDLAAHRWVLLLDADEALTAESQEEIRKLMRSGPRADGYEIPRREQHYWRMSSTSVRRDYFLRLLDKTKGGMTDKPVHAAPRVDGRIERLRHYFLHFGMASIHGKAARLNNYSTGLVADKLDRGKRGSPWMMIFYPPVSFIREYIVERQIFNGWSGFILSALSAHYVFLKYAKLYEHFQFEKHGRSLLPDGAPAPERAQLQRPA